MSINFLFSDWDSDDSMKGFPITLLADLPFSGLLLRETVNR